ncbi:MAG: ion channel protein [Flavobacteriaceae bacterium]
MKKVIFCLLFLASFLTVGQPNDLFEKGNAYYIEGNYQKAIDAYQSILDSGQHSGELYFNLGNAYYKQEAIAPSIFYYEKAKQMLPKDEEVINNLSYANNRTIDNIAPMPASFWDSLNDAIVNKLTLNQWAKLSVAMVLLCVLSFSFFIWSDGSVRKRFSFILAIVVMFAFGVSLTLTFHKNNLDKNNRPAIIFDRQNSLSTEPNSLSDKVIDVHEGLKVFVLEYYDSEWAKVELPDGKTGWIKSSAFRLL